MQIFGSDSALAEKVRLVESSGLFDPAFYTTELRRKGMRAPQNALVVHYINKGARAGLDPSPYFSGKAYATEYGIGSRLNPLVHHIERALRQLKQGDEFDPAYYLATYPDVARAYVNAAWHFLSAGCHEGRQPSATISAEAVCQGLGWKIIDRTGGAVQPADAAEEAPSVPEVDPVEEIVGHEFDVGYYLTHNPDVIGASMSPVQHYLRHGWQEGRDPAPWFSTRDYLSQYPDVVEAGLNPFHHFLSWGRAEGRLPKSEASSEANSED